MKHDRSSVAFTGRQPELWALARLAALITASAGLAVALAAADSADRVAFGVTMACAAIAVGMLALSSRRSARLAAAALIAVGLSLGLVLSSAEGSYVGVALLLASFLPLSVSLIRDLAAVEGERESARDRAAPEADDEIVAELNRARRYERPLTVVTLSVATERIGPLAARRAIVDLMRSLAVCLRQSDLVRLRGPARLVLVLPETGGGDADLLLERVYGTLREPALGAVRVGAAAFPNEEVTWVGLERRAVERERLVGSPPFFGAPVPGDASSDARDDTDRTQRSQVPDRVGVPANQAVSTGLGIRAQ